MGVDTRRPVLPAPTDSSAVESANESVAGTDLATDLSRVTDKSHYSIPDDGRPITISTHKKGEKGKLIHGRHQSQTSLLIEYFEAGKEGSDLKARPSIRVKVTPSSKARKGKEQHDHLLVTESGTARRPSHTRRISLGTSDSKSASSLNLVTDDPGRAHRNPHVEVELLPRSDISGSSVSRDARFIEPSSDISSMPPDSLLEGATTATRPARSRSVSREDVGMEKDTLKAPARRRSRSLSRERLVTRKVIEKLGERPHESSSGRRHHSSRSRSISNELLKEEETRSPKRRVRKHREDESIVTGAESGLTSSSLLSPNRKSGDQYSFRSGTSKSSINNPRLLETVEDAIRRLILPELKELKKDQKVEKNRKVFERDTDSSLVSGSSASREEPRRRVSKRSGGDGGKPRVVLNRDGKESEELLSSGSRRRKERKQYDYDSPSERSSSRRESGDSTIVEEEKARRKRRERRAREAAVGVLAGGALTAAALKHHDSKSSIERSERKKRRSKSRSRSASIAESEEIFQKHEVPPMPMRSEVDSDLTRSSLLSEQTASTTTPTHKEVRNVVRGSPKEMRSPTAVTPTRTPANLQKGLGTHHGNVSKGDLSLRTRTETEPSVHSSDVSPGEGHHDKFGDAALAGVAGGIGGLAGAHLLDDRERVRRYEQNLHHQHPIRRGLSPIQSVASYRDDTSEPNRDSVLYSHSMGSSSSLHKQKPIHEERSFDSISSGSVGIAKKRPVGVNLEKPNEILAQHDDRFDGPRTQKDVDDWYDEQHRENDRYRDSYNSSDSRYDDRRLTNYTDDSYDAPYEDKVGASQQLARGAANNPEYMHTPEAVESAVASLYEPSVLDTRSVPSSQGSFAEGLDREALSPKPLNYSARDVSIAEKGSPLKRSYVPERDEPSFQERAAALSPPQSVTQSIEDRDLPEMGASGLPIANDPLPEIGHGLDSPDSEITTNPSVIQGPIGGISHENREHWPYDPTPPRSKGDMMSPAKDRNGLSATEAALAGGAIGAGLGATAAKAHGNQVEQYDDKFEPNRNAYMGAEPISSPLGNQDEGYISGKPPTTGALTPDLKGKKQFDDGAMDAIDDPFIGRSRYLSGLSHGMESPLYDNATGQGIDRIQSKDIVALMDHLTVRDAQRNARDTEILVTLVRSAAEMRNSFEDMKKFITDQDEYIMDTADRQHEKTVKQIIGGPRPQPVGPKFTPQRTPESAEDSTAKRQNVFRRALRGLGAKNNAELQNIEAMLNHLLGEVEVLRAAQEGRPTRPGTNSFNSGENRGTLDSGYEPEGQAGTSSTGGDRSEYMSNNSSRQGVGHGGARRASDNPNRVSTVMEGDEDPETLEPYEQEVLDQPNEDELLTPTRDMRNSRDDLPGATVPLNTIARKPIPENGAYSNENTPRISINSKPDKHKSSSSSFFPKFSRWSKTTASSVGDAFRTSTQSKKERPYSHVSRSGDGLGEYEYEYDPAGDDHLRSRDSLGNAQRHENRPPSPLIPSQVSDDPKFQAHRNSMNLQHPQPRQGPTGRYQYHLESQADTYGPQSPTASEAEHWAAMAEPRLLPSGMDGGSDAHQLGNGLTDRQSPLSDVYSESSSAMMELGEEEARRSAASTSSTGTASAPPPPRPPKVRDDGPLIPERPPKIAMSPAPNTRQPTYVDHVAAQRGSSLSPAAAGPSMARKPSGPRPIVGSGQWNPSGRGATNGGANGVANGEGGHLADVKKTRFRGSPNHISSSEESLSY